MSGLSFLGGRKLIGFMVIGIVAFGAYLYFFVGFDSLLALFTIVNLYDYFLFYSLAIAFVVLAVFFDSLIWYYLLKGLSVRIKLRKVVLFNWVGNFVEMVIPAMMTLGGEATRIYLAKKEPQSNLGISAATVITSRMLSTFIYTGGLLVGFIALSLRHALPVYLLAPVIMITVGTGLVIGVIIYIALKDGAVEKLVNLLMRVLRIIVKDPYKLQSRKEGMQKSLFSFRETFMTYRKKPRLLIIPLIFAFISWLFSLLVLLMVFYSLNFTSLSLIDLATVYCIASTVETITAGLPIGAVEITMINLYALYGVPIIVAGAATTLSRLLTFWTQVLIGYPLINVVGLKSAVSESIKKSAIVPIPIIPIPISSSTPEDEYKNTINSKTVTGGKQD